MEKLDMLLNPSRGLGPQPAYIMIGDINTVVIGQGP